MIKDFLPVSRSDMEKRGWDQCDFVYVCGDAYVDHPSFGHAIISRLLEAHGFRVGIISQPDWKDEKSISILGKPRLGFLVSAGNMDSMVNHYTVSRKRRQKDAYTPGGVMGKRPDNATIVYCFTERFYPSDRCIVRVFCRTQMLEHLINRGQHYQVAVIIQQRSDGRIDYLVSPLFSDHSLGTIADTKNLVFMRDVSSVPSC